MTWTGLPNEEGWYWFRVDSDRYPGLPQELTDPHMILLSRHPISGAMKAHDLAEPLCEFDAAKMVGFWEKVQPPSEAR